MTNAQPTPVLKPTLAREELPLKVRDAAVFLGVSPQTVYLWVERKQTPHLRVMGRNIRFLKSKLEPDRSGRGAGLRETVPQGTCRVGRRVLFSHESRSRKWLIRVGQS